MYNIMRMVRIYFWGEGGTGLYDFGASPEKDNHPLPYAWKKMTPLLENEILNVSHMFIITDSLHWYLNHINDQEYYGEIHSGVRDNQINHSTINY